MQKHTYVAIDLKSFYASVECVARGLDPLKENLVVADPTKTEKTICLAVSPSLKALGIPGRARLYEVIEKAQGINLTIAPPRMQKYIDVSQQIFKIYQEFIAPEDIHPYSIDEVFMDVTNYLKYYNLSAYELTKNIIASVLAQTGITATAGIGENLYLAKIAMDIEAKHQLPDQNGARIAELTEKSYREKLWQHQPLTDFWQIGHGIERRLNKLGIHNMGELAKFSLEAHDKLYKEFGVKAELLIDHAWGHEPVGIKDIKSYESKNHSMQAGQVLKRPYTNKEAQIIVLEMADNLSLDLVKKDLQTDQIVITICYDTSNSRGYSGELVQDYYGRPVPKEDHGTINLGRFTSSGKEISAKTLELFNKITNPALTIRRIYINANHIMHPSAIQKQIGQKDLFINYQQNAQNDQKEHNLQVATLKIKQKYGKNAILKAISYEDAGTARERNEEIGGHRA